MRTVRPLLSLLGAILLGGSLFQAPAGAGTLTWDLAADFSVAPPVVGVGSAGLGDLLSSEAVQA